ncbi:hypothetical protein DAI22_12g177300 [Oryza sativa Japonica Group]|nr:hypothetical protein DAI22_12g177300 [Oryza sativa Japonica Group]
MPLGCQFGIARTPSQKTPRILHRRIKDRTATMPPHIAFLLPLAISSSLPPPPPPPPPQIGNLTPPSLTRSPPASPPHQDKAGNPAAAADSRRFWKLLGHPTHSRRRPARCRKRLHA